MLAGMRKLYDGFARRDSMAALDHMTNFIQTAEERFVALGKEAEAAEAGRRKRVS